MSIHSVAVLIQIPMTNGKPDLQLPPSVDVVREAGTPFVHVTWGDDRCMTLQWLGNPAGGDPVFVGVMRPRVALALAHLGARVRRLYTAWQNATIRAWLEGKGIVADENGFPIPPHVIAGDAVVGDDGQP